MKRKKVVGLAALSMGAALSLGIGIGLGGIAASAETVYSSSERDYWVFTSGSGDYTVSLDTAARGEPTYKGVETVITPAEGVKDVGITLKGRVDPMQFSIFYNDNQVKGTADADAIVYTYTSMADPDKQVSIICTNRDNRSWYTLAFTDDLEVKDGFTYVAGTQQKAIGFRDMSHCDESGFNYGNENSWGAIYNGDYWLKLDSEGKVYYNSTTDIGNIKNEDFLSLSKKNLSGTKYEERYTAEYAQEVISALSKGARMEIKWYGVKTDKLDFHIRQINGTWIGDAGGKGLESAATSTSIIAYKKRNVLYVGETYKLSDLVYAGLFSFRTDGKQLVGWYAKSVNKTADNNSDSLWYNGLTQLNKSVTMNEAGTYSLTIGGNMGNYYLPAADGYPRNMTFEVVNKTSVIYKANGAEQGRISAERWEEIALAEPSVEQLASLPAGYAFGGWKIGDKTYAAGDKYMVGGDGADVVCEAVIKDVQKPTITVGNYTEEYYDGDEVTLLAATVADNSGEELAAKIAVTKDGAAIEISADNKIALTAGAYKVTYTAKDSAGNETAEERTITVKPCEVQYASLTLNGDIGLNFYAKLSSKETAPNALLGFANGDKEQCAGEYVDALGLWKFTYLVAPKDYKKEVSFDLTAYNGTKVAAAHSVETYLNNAQESDKHYALCVNTKAYCEAARVYFAGEDATATAALAADLSAYQGSVSGEDENVTILGATLKLETKTSVRVYFKAVNAENLVCTIDGASAEIKEENGFKYLEISDIAVKDLGGMHEFKIGGVTVNYGAISYVKAVANVSENVALDNVMKALYNAFVVGAEYFKAD